MEFPHDFCLVMRGYHAEVEIRSLLLIRLHLPHLVLRLIAWSVPPKRSQSIHMEHQFRHVWKNFCLVQGKFTFVEDLG